MEQTKYQKYRERNLQNKRDHYQKNKERIKAYQAEYRAKNKDRIAIRDAEYRKTHATECNLRSRARAARVKGKVVKEEITNWGANICGICDELLDGLVEMDHILPLNKGGLHTADNLQLTHRTCNRRKKDQIGFTLTERKAPQGV